MEKKSEPTEQKLFPRYKDVALKISTIAETDPERFFTHIELADLLGVAYKTHWYYSLVIKLRRELLNEYGLVLTVKRDEGYKLATDEEKTNIEADRHYRKGNIQFKKEGRVLAVTDTQNLSDETQAIHEKRMIRYGMLRVVKAKLRLGNISSGMSFTVSGDVPRLIDI